jgi:hypothetical protein
MKDPKKELFYWKDFSYDKKNKENRPKSPGKYVITTETSMGGTNRFETTWSGETWGCTNQTVKQWLERY